MGKGPDTGLPEAVAALFTCKGPVLRLFVLIYFKLGKAEAGWGRGPLSLHGEGGRRSFFTLTFFFFLLCFPFSFSIWGPWGFQSSPHLVPWIVFSLSVDSNL